jgi:type II secretory pathway component GspD/PulD (secretin)
MGGLVRTSRQHSRNKVPLLGDIPLIGKWLFQSWDVDVSDRELLIFVTPRILPRIAQQGT